MSQKKSICFSKRDINSSKVVLLLNSPVISPVFSLFLGSRPLKRVSSSTFAIFKAVFGVPQLFLSSINSPQPKKLYCSATLRGTSIARITDGTLTSSLYKSGYGYPSFKSPNERFKRFSFMPL